MASKGVEVTEDLIASGLPVLALVIVGLGGWALWLAVMAAVRAVGKAWRGEV